MFIHSFIHSPRTRICFCSFHDTRQDGFDDGDARRAAGDKKRSALWVDPLKPREIGPTHVRRTLILEVLEKIAAQRHFAINRTIALLFERINGHYATLHKGQARSH